MTILSFVRQTVQTERGSSSEQAGVFGRGRLEHTGSGLVPILRKVEPHVLPQAAATEQQRQWPESPGSEATCRFRLPARRFWALLWGSLN